MRIPVRLLSALLLLAAALPAAPLHAQNSSPYWSQKGNANANAASVKFGTTNGYPLRIYTNNFERLRIDTNGYLGIGTTAPTRPLHVVGGGLFSNGLTVQNGGISSVNSGGTGVYGASTTSYGVYGSSGNIGVYGAGSSYGVYGYSGAAYGVYGSGGYVGIYGSASAYGVYGYSPSAYGVYGYSNNGTGVLGYSNNLQGGYFYSLNDCGIRARSGRTEKSWAGVFEGNLYHFGAYQTSDQALKQNIEDCQGALGIIGKLKPHRFEYRRDGKLAGLNLPTGKHFGLLAQELEATLPQLVQEVENEVFLPDATALPPSPNGTAAVTPPAPVTTVEKISLKAVNYTELIPLLIRAIQEQQEQIQKLQEEVNSLKNNQPVVSLPGRSPK
ncbi:tail fiber domain-containing protein [Paraflavisolibacter sp. H34]|uniref:tail fiber domain-containing protein n=1 Tax=Huijunlia imazamoxiresistens TaxID=3127457 RepID=UPI00301AC950